jgi:hypothetical protein
MSGVAVSEKNTEARTSWADGHGGLSDVEGAKRCTAGCAR